uniref:Uncharacterized protein n=1 Tax=Parascaris equorum TaxID=6256 RepID=A0A914RBR0_PAREQ
MMEKLLFFFVIGVDSTCEDIDAEVVCNGPLKPGAAYRFKLRILVWGINHLCVWFSFITPISYHPVVGVCVLQVYSISLTIVEQIGIKRFLEFHFGNLSMAEFHAIPPFTFL